MCFNMGPVVHALKHTNLSEFKHEPTFCTVNNEATILSQWVPSIQFCYKKSCDLLRTGRPSKNVKSSQNTHIVCVCRLSYSSSSGKKKKEKNEVNWDSRGQQHMCLLCNAPLKVTFYWLNDPMTKQIRHILSLTDRHIHTNIHIRLLTPPRALISDGPPHNNPPADGFHTKDISHVRSVDVMFLYF